VTMSLVKRGFLGVEEVKLLCGLIKDNPSSIPIDVKSAAVKTLCYFAFWRIFLTDFSYLLH
jgi:hypothetical protein